MIDQDRIIRVNIEKEMKASYIDYSMSVIVSRALPDVRDGLKPVHRRVLYGMDELGNNSDKPYKKSARIVGDVLGKYHPHGDSSVYFAMVRLAQSWAMRYCLVDGQGNFGSIDGDSPAAMRYTECRLNKLAEEMLVDIDKNTVDMNPNFDETLKEPSVLPSKVPNLLLNGASGIAVGMATNMPPHNLCEIVDGMIAYIDNNDITIPELMKYIIAPDFPTGGTIYGYAGVKEAFETGRGRIVIRAKAEIEAEASHERIIVTEIPYNVNKADLITSIANLVKDHKLDGISHINDESDRDGMRIVIDVKKDFNANVVLNKLYKMTAMQSSFSVNNIALVHGRPKLLNLKDLIKYFIDHRHEVVTRRTQHELDEAKKRAHILEGRIIACDNIDKVVQIIRSSNTPDEAKNRLVEEFELSMIQARDIVEMRLRQLTGLEIQKLRDEYAEIEKKIEWYQKVLGDITLRMDIIKKELNDIKDKYGDDRRTDIVYASEEFNPEDFYGDDEMVITISHLGYIKRTPLSEYKSQNRGGVGSKGSNTRDEDFIEYIYNATMHNTLMFFTQKGTCFWLKVYEIPEGAKNAKGRAIQNLLNINKDDKVNAFIRIKNLQSDEDFINSHYLVFCTKNGLIKKTLLEAYSRPRQNGVRAINIREDDKVIGVSLTNGNCDIVIANKNGRAIRFHESKVRAMGRTATGVRAITLDDDGQDEVVGMVRIKDPLKETIMVISEKGYGKRSLLNDYRVTNRGGKGVKTINITEKTGKLVSIMGITEENDLMIINKSGITIRLDVNETVRIMGRATQGVRLIDLNKRNDEIASVCCVLSEKEESGEDLDNTDNNGPTDENTNEITD